MNSSKVMPFIRPEIETKNFVQDSQRCFVHWYTLSVTTYFFLIFKLNRSDFYFLILYGLNKQISFKKNLPTTELTRERKNRQQIKKKTLHNMAIMPLIMVNESFEELRIRTKKIVVK